MEQISTGVAGEDGVRAMAVPGDRALPHLLARCDGSVQVSRTT